MNVASPDQNSLAIQPPREHTRTLYARYSMAMLQSGILLLLLVAAQLTHSSKINPLYVPLVSQHDIDTIPWPAGYLRLQRGQHLYLYHNYTQVDQPGYDAIYRYLSRETILHYKRVTRSHLFPSHLTGTVYRRGASPS